MMFDAYMQSAERHSPPQKLVADTLYAMRTKRRSKRAILRYSLTAACFLILFLSASLLIPRHLSGSEPPTRSEICVSLGDMSARVTLIVNESENLALSTDRLGGGYTDLSKLPMQVWREELARFEKRVGVKYENFTPTLPDDLALYGFGSIYLDAYKDNPNASPYEYIFEYASAGDRCAVVSLSGEEEPDYLDGDAEPCEIGGVLMTVYGCGERRAVRFICAGVHCCVETVGLEDEELAALLLSIAKMGMGR